MDNKSVPGSAARAGEQEPRTASAKTEPGSAARTAEQSAHESTAVPREAFRGSMTIRTGIATGAKFQFAANRSGPGEALPEGYKAPAASSAANQSVNVSQSGRVNQSISASQSVNGAATQQNSVGVESGKSEAVPVQKTASGSLVERFRKLFKH
jgi:hypothetical protein